jgi:hypothetical protein
MPILSKPSSAARTALIYITAGTLMVIWTIIWWTYLRGHPPAGDGPFYWCIGFLVTGIALVIIGLAVGQIGRSARHAELPPPEVTAAEAKSQQTAAARAPVVAPVNPAMPTFANPGQAVAAKGQAPVVPPVGTSSASGQTTTANERRA